MTPESLAVRHVLGCTAQTIEVIGLRTGLHRRAVEEAIQSLRLAHVPIVSGSDGVRLSGDPAEVARGAEALHQRAVHQMETAGAMRETSRRMAAVPPFEAVEVPGLWGKAS